MVIIIIIIVIIMVIIIITICWKGLRRGSCQVQGRRSIGARISSSVEQHWLENKIKKTSIGGTCLFLDVSFVVLHCEDLFILRLLSPSRPVFSSIMHILFLRNVFLWQEEVCCGDLVSKACELSCALRLEDTLQSWPGKWSWCYVRDGYKDGTRMCTWSCW